MPDIWLVPRLGWIATIVVYLVLSIIPGRLRSWEKRINDGLFVAVLAFVGIRILTRFVFHGGLVFQLALVIAGVAGAVGILFRLKALIARIAMSGEGE